MNEPLLIINKQNFSFNLYSVQERKYEIINVDKSKTGFYVNGLIIKIIMYENQKEILIKYIMVQENENQIEEIIKANNKIIEDSIENMMIQVILNKN